jgi:hypothetical protein
MVMTTVLVGAVDAAHGEGLVAGVAFLEGLDDGVAVVEGVGPVTGSVDGEAAVGAGDAGLGLEGGLAGVRVGDGEGAGGGALGTGVSSLTVLRVPVLIAGRVVYRV